MIDFLKKNALKITLLLTVSSQILYSLLGNVFYPESQQQIRLSVLSGYFCAIFFIAILVFFRFRHEILNNKLPLALYLSLATYFVSSFLGHGDWSKFQIISPLFFITIFVVFKDLSHTICGLYWVRILFFFLVIPIFLIPFEGLGWFEFSTSILDSFRGFSSSRTDYGYLSGIVILMLFIQQRRYFVPMAALVFLGLLLSSNRASIVALLASGLVAYWDKIKKQRVSYGLIAVICIFIFIISFIYNETNQRGVGLTQDSGDRFEIILSSIEALSQNFLFGAGHFFQNIYVHALQLCIEPHNSILQSLLNFGALATFSWLYFVFVSFKDFNKNARGILTYWFMFGLFHPGFDAFLFLPESNLAILAALEVNLNE